LPHTHKTSMRRYTYTLTATHCNTLQHTATHCNTLQRTATHCNTLQHIGQIYLYRLVMPITLSCDYSPNVLPNVRFPAKFPPQKMFRVAVFPTTYCVTLQHTAAHCNTLRHTATLCDTLQHTATHCNTLQHTATHCNTPQHTATQRVHEAVCTAPLR